jgi:alpha-1,6-mannosyltransferase
VIAVLNPLTLLALVGGAHNDAIMIGLLLAGVTACKSRHPVWGVVLCTLAAAIKVPAAIGIVYVAWEWAGPDVALRERVRPFLKAGSLALAVMTTLTLVSGLGFGWIANLGTPGTVRSWMAPATAIGLLISGAFHVVGVGVGIGGVLTVTRFFGLLGAVIVAVWCLRNYERLGMLRALGLSMLMFVVLGPVVQPWYLTWGLIVMAPIVTGRLRNVTMAISMVGPFIGLTGGADLLGDLMKANPFAMVLAVFVLWCVVMVPLGSWTTSWRLERARLSAALPTNRPSGLVAEV